MARRLFVLFVPLVLLAGACSSGDQKAAGATTSSTSSTSTTVAETSTTEAPNPSQPAPTSTTTPAGSGIPLTGPAGSGSAAYSLAPERSEFCYRISVKGVGKPSESHVHRSTGEVVLGLQAPPTDGTVNTCAATDALLIEEIGTNPGNFYIDVHAPKGVLKATLR